MKKLFRLATLFFFVWGGIAYATIESDVYTDLSHSISRVKEPEIKGKYIIFTADSAFRHVGIAFESEDYKTVHTFKRLPVGSNPNRNGVLFYIAEIPEETSEINYRLVMDGLWTTDPMNSEQFFDYTLGLSVSHLSVPYRREYKTSTTNAQTKGVTFVFDGRPGQTVRLAGTFNNWDPFMYELIEIQPGKYELTLPLPYGKWTYAFFIGSTQIHDRTNSNTVYTADGKIGSVIFVK